ncbi:MAG: SOS response-associated peptidase [SAR86 cluster bacterium]
MCGRFNVVSAPLTQFVMEILGSDSPVPDLPTEYNIAPTEQVQVVYTGSDRRSLAAMRWWLVPHWAPEPSSKYSMFNAKSETLATSRAFRDAFKSRRCIVPVSGYYEWRTEQGIKVPYYVEADADNGLALAGLWDRWEKAERVIYSCTIVTAAAPQSMQALHRRIPVHLNRAEITQWLDMETAAEPLAALLAPTLRVPLTITPVSPYVNNARHKDSRCVEPTGSSVRIALD